MAASNYPKVMAEVFKHEGGYVDHPRDPGGATNLGITHLTLAAHRGHRVTKADVKALGKQEAENIYRKSYWAKVNGDHLPYGFDLVAMDGAVNSGPSRGAKWLQIGVGATADGKIGGQTIEAARRSDVGGIERACDARMSFLRGLKHWGTFGKGWSRRVASVEAVGTRMWLTAAEGTKAARTGMQERAERAVTQAQDERRAGAAQVGATSGGGVGGATLADLPTAAIMALALGAVVVAALLFIRSRRKADYHEARREAYAAHQAELSDA